MAAGRRSELEQVVLGIVWKFGPLTPHAVRAQFTGSRSARFSASAGAIYPLMARLERARLVRSRRDRRSLQRRRLYAITPTGMRRLRSWLAPPFQASDVAALHDPIRARVYFLAALPPRARRRFLAEAEARLTDTLRLLRSDIATHRRAGSSLSALALAGAEQVARAQIRWLRAIRPWVTRAGVAPRSPRSPRSQAPRRSRAPARRA